MMLVITGVHECMSASVHALVLQGASGAVGLFSRHLHADQMWNVRRNSTALIYRAHP